MIVVLPLADATRTAAALVGGKAAALGELMQAGHRVPSGFVVTTTAFHAHLAAANATALLAADSPSALLLAAVKNTPIDPDCVAQVHAAFRALVANGGTCAVRSSAVGEDGAERSFAGQHSTYYHVRADQLLARIVDCWLSCFSSHAREYRARASQASPAMAVPPAMAVIVQLLVPAEVSGVTFTRDPTGKNDGAVVIEACWGLGAALVDGRVTPDRYWVDRGTLETSERHIGEKLYRVRETDAHDASGRLEQVPRPMRRRATLDDAACARAARLALDCEAHFGVPQDVEWAIAGGELYLLQSRPVTGAPPRRTANVDGQWVIFKPIFENFTGPLTPLSVDLLSRVVPPLGRFIDGRWYTSFSAMKLMMPFEISDAALVELNMLRAPAERPGVTWRKLAIPLIAGLVLYLVWGILLVRTRHLDIRSFEASRARCAKLLADDGIDALTTLRRLTTAASPFARAGQLPFPANICAGAKFFVYQALLRLYTTRFLPSLDEAAMSALCAPGREVASMRLLADLDAVADAARATPRIARMLAVPGERDLLMRIGATVDGAGFVTALERFIATYGHRGVRELEIGAPRWGEDPASLLPMIRARLSSPTQVPAASSADVRTLVDARTRNPLHRAIVGTLARSVRRFAALRENTRQFHVLAFTTVRRKLLALELELLQAGRLKCSGDIFYLTWDEVNALDRGTLDWVDVEPRVRSRRLVQRAREGRMPPLTFNIDLAPVAVRSQGLAGTCACVGEAIGTAHVVLDPATAELKPGDILVAPYTDPSWTPLFPMVAAIVVETGSYLSHAGTVARELGVPCVVDVAGCTRLIRSGQRLHVRATDGEVFILDPVPTP